MRNLIASLALATTATFYTGIAHSVEITRPKAVLELFTSQGCYSCPPADEIVGKLSKTNEILALGRHVDYWDYLGWKDSFASRENTELQYAYARSMRERQVYTPQAVINGRAHVVGSHERKIHSVVRSLEQSGQGMSVPINVQMEEDRIKVSIPKSEEASDATLYLVFFDKSETVEIARGENGGKTLTYHNIVKDTEVLGMVKPGGLEMAFPLAEFKRRGFEYCAIILQKHDNNGNPSAIIGASVLSDI